MSWMARAAALGFFLWIPAGADGGAVPSTPASTAVDAPAWRSVRVHRDRFSVRWRPRPDPIPFNEPFQLEVEVARSEGAKELLDGAQVVVSAWMPAHRHGMARQPRAVDSGDGTYLVRGMLLHMKGHWQIFVDVNHEGLMDRAEIAVDLAGTAVELSDEELAKVFELSPLPPPPDDPTNAYDTSEAAARLGQFLFFDTRLSGTGEVACATCHRPERGWSDGKPLGEATGRLERNTQSLWNAAYGRWYFWDGRADSLWAQALHPLEDEREHAGNRLSYAHLVDGDPDLRRAYVEVFGELPDLSDGARFPPAARPVPDDPDHPHARAWDAMDPADRDAVDRVFANLGKALAAYERQLVSRDAPFDRFVRELREDPSASSSALPEAARRGLKLFLGRGRCQMCHSGPNFTDYEFHNTRLPPGPGGSVEAGRFQGSLRVRSDPFNGLGPHSDVSPGPDRRRIEEKLDYLLLSGDSWGEHKTPSLRNVALTGPYMHHGQIATLDEVVEFYSDGVNAPRFHVHEEQILRPAHLSAEEKSDLVAFLEALTDADLPAELTRPPATPYLPPSDSPTNSDCERGEPCD